MNDIKRKTGMTKYNNTNWINDTNYKRQSPNKRQQLNQQTKTKNYIKQQ